MNTDNPIHQKFNNQEIADKFRQIYASLIESSQSINVGNFTQIGSADLRFLFQEYDRMFFDGSLKQNFEHKIRFELSKRMTRSGGKCVFSPKSGLFRIVISVPLIFQTFNDVPRKIMVNGLECRDRLEALMHIFEHELIHLIEFSLSQTSSCSQQRFRTLSHNLFGHTEVTHQLVTQTERAFRKFELRVGDQVKFNIEHQEYHGFINRITKRATVLVRSPQGNFSDRQGHKYKKYYVPLPMLTKI